MMLGIISLNRCSRPRGVVVTGKKPALVVNVCTSPPSVGSNAIAGRRQKENIANKTVFNLNCLKFVLIFDKCQVADCFCCENSIKVEADCVG